MLIFAAYIQPLDPYLFEADTDKKARLLLFQSLFFSLWLIPAIPAIVGGLALLGMFPIPRLLARILAGFSVVLGLFLTLASGAFGPFTDTQALHGVSLTIALASSFLIWSGLNGKPQPSWAAKIGISVATVTALWSLLTVPVVLVQARTSQTAHPIASPNMQRILQSKPCTNCADFLSTPPRPDTNLHPRGTFTV